MRAKNGVGSLLPFATVILMLTAWSPAQAAPQSRAVLETYADIAHAAYGDSLERAKTLQSAVGELVARPSAETLQAARAAWLASRIPYMQTEVFRFGNPIVDEWEGKVNAWPLDEGLIDYVAGSYGKKSPDNPLYTANVIANRSITIGGAKVDASRIDKRLLGETLHEAGGIEANVATGYHAVEFLLWGQDLHGTGPGSGERPWTDYARGERCTHGHCARRADYLSAATDLLVDDLAWMVTQWGDDGAARAALTANGPERGLAAILTGLGSLSYGELAGERMKLGLMLHDPEEEHDCFSDNTQDSHYYDVVGMLNVYSGTYTRIDGRKLLGPAISHLVAAAAPELNGEMLSRLAATEAAMATLRHRAQTVEHYDQMIAAGNEEGNAVVQAAIDALTAQTKVIERIVSALDVGTATIEGSDSLDNPAAVFK